MSGSDVVVVGGLVLAAVDRAERHRARSSPEVPTWAVMEHVGVRPRSAQARRVRAGLDALAEAGSLERSRRHGAPAWTLTDVGRRRLGRARAAGSVPVLPEAPQHVAWRSARAAAEERVEAFTKAVGEGVLQTFFMLDGVVDGRPIGSDEWFEMAERLQRACRTLGSARYCLDEWEEPEDDRADIDTHEQPEDEMLPEQERKRRRARRSGRRNIRLWETPASPAGGER
jgi:hypothetical protein